MLPRMGRFRRRQRWGSAGVCIGLAGELVFAVWHPGGLAVTVLLLTLAALLTLLGIVQVVWDTRPVRLVRIVVAPRDAVPRISQLAPQSLDLAQLMEIDTTVISFQASEASFKRQGTILAIRCKNRSHSRSITQCRIHMDSVAPVEGGAAPDGFTPAFLTWDTGAIERSLGPLDSATAGFVRHDAQYAMVAHVTPVQTKLAWELPAGRWEVRFTISSARLRPASKSVAFESLAAPRYASDSPGELRLL